VFFYDSAPSGPPDATLTFQNVLGSSYQISSGGDLPIETDTFNFINVVPEPSSMALLIIGIVGWIGFVRCRRQRV
jgi:hypothetical protein